MFGASLLPDEHEFKYGDSGLYHQSPRFDLLHTLPDRSAYCVLYVDTSVIKMPLSSKKFSQYSKLDPYSAHMIESITCEESICSSDKESRCRKFCDERQLRHVSYHCYSVSQFLMPRIRRFIVLLFFFSFCST
jgi:hypothetical protein